MKKKSPDIAIVGLSCWYPGARNATELWENVLTKRQEFRRMLDCRLPLDEYYNADKSQPDLTYGTQAAYLDGFNFDWVTNRFPKSSFESTDLVHWLALDVVSNAIQNAGYDRKTIPLQRTGVLVGNTLTGEVSRANGLRLRWPYFRKVIKEAAKSRGMNVQELEVFLENSEKIFKSVFAPTTEDTLAGCLSNTVAGRICNYFNLDGGGFTVDGACSSSLLAVANSASALAAGDLDMAIAGGVDISLDTFELIGFAKVGALTEKEMKVYDKDGKGFIPGEGCGFVVLKRLDDAIRDGNKIHGLLKGWGISSDGSGGITAPKASGQSLALKRAYEKAEYKISDCHFIEGHGTGTAVGDRRELEGISLTLKDHGGAPSRSIGVTSLKSIIGHTKAAAGIGAFIKAVIGVNRRILPPIAGCENWNPIFENDARSLFPLVDGEKKNINETLRAGISAMGFGGINCHVTVESYGPPSPEFSPFLNEEVMLASHQDADAFFFTSQSLAQMKIEVQKAIDESQKMARSECTDLAHELSQKAVSSFPYRAVIIASTPEDIKIKLEELVSFISSPPNELEYKVNITNTVFLSNKTSNPKVAFLFPGQGSQRLNMSKKVVQRHPWAQSFVDKADQVYKEITGSKLSDYVFKNIQRSQSKDELSLWNDQLTSTNVAQPAICLSSLLWVRRLNELGIQPNVVVGHSLGELTALQVAGAFDESELIRLASLRGAVMTSSAPDERGGMISLVCNLEKAQEIANEIGLTVANINSPEQIVLSGAAAGIEQAIKLAGSKGISAVKLKVSNAFHTPFMDSASKKFYNEIKKSSFNPKNFPRVISTVSGSMIDCEIDLQSHLSSQIVEPVDFVSSIQKTAEQCDIMFEVGPGSILTGLVRSTLGNNKKCFPVESNPDKMSDHLKAAALFFVAGGFLKVEKLFENRFHRKYTAFEQKNFIINPCEKEFPIEVLNSLNLNQNVFAANAHTNVVSQTQLNQTAQVSGDSVVVANLMSTQQASPVAPMKEQVASSQVIPFPTKIANEAPHLMSEIEIRAALIDILVENTGFSKDVFKMEMRLLDDLNLDSIKASEVITSLTKICNISGQIDPIQIANADLAEIVQIISKMSPLKSASSNTIALQDESPQKSNVPVAADISLKQQEVKELQSPMVSQKSVKDPSEVIYEAVSRITGFDRSILKPEMRLLDDLNLDSIKASEVLVSVQKEFPDIKSMDPIQLANATLEGIATYFREQLNSTSKGDASQKTDDLMLDIVVEEISKITDYPIAAISSEAKLSSDLRIDSGKVALIFSSIAKRLGTEAGIDSDVLADASVKKIAQVFATINTSKVKSSEAGMYVQNTEKPWVRNFKVELAPKARIASDYKTLRWADQFQNSKVLVFVEWLQNPLVISFVDYLKESGANVTLSSASEVAKLKLEEVSTFGYVIYFAAQEKSEKNDIDQIQSSIERYQFLASIPRPTGSTRRYTTVAVVQSGDGYFCTKDLVPNLDQMACIPFLQTLHIERNDLRVRCLDVARGLDSQKFAREIAEDLLGPQMMDEVGYNLQGQRLGLKLSAVDPSSYPKRKIDLSPSDVLLVTGGGKGISAECALALSSKTMMKVALVGRTALDANNEELQANLKKFKDARIEFKYYSCDVADENAVLELVHKVEKDLGAITAVLHGAGANKPRLASSVSVDEARKEISAKVLGAAHLIKHLDPTKLKVFSAFTSIIGVMGVPGNAWYGFSNDVLNRLISKLKKNNNHIHTVTCAYGMWDEVGMAAKLGSGKKFSSLGLTLIPPKEGVDRYLHLMFNDPGYQQTIVTSRLWNQSSLTPKDKPSSSFRFLENIVHSTVGVETRSRVRLSLDKDLYLKDHCYNGLYLMPTVFGLEAMTQAAKYTLGMSEFNSLTITNLLLTAPIVVDPEKGVEIEVYCIIKEVLENDQKVLEVGIRSENSKFSRDVFSATFSFSSGKDGLRNIEKWPEAKTEIDPLKELYGPLLFHGPTYQRIEKVLQLDSKEGMFEVRAEEKLANHLHSFSEKDLHLSLGDPFLRDSLLQSGQAVLTKFIFLPAKVDRWEIYSLTEKSGKQLVHFKVIDFDGKRITADITCYNETGQITECLYGSQGIVTKAIPSNPTPEQIVIASQKMAAAANTGQHKHGFEKLWTGRQPQILEKTIPGFASLTKEDRHHVETEVAQEALSDFEQKQILSSDFQLSWNTNGKPQIHYQGRELHINFSHIGNHCVCILAEKEVGCDIEEIKPRILSDWNLLLGPDFAQVFQSLFEKHEDRVEINILGTAVWAAREAAGKAIGQPTFPMKYVGSNEKGFIFSVTNNERHFQVFATQSPNEKNQVFALCWEDDSVKTGIAPQTFESALDVPVDSEKDFSVQWPIIFKDAANPKKGVYFSRFFEWQGRAREMALWPILSEATKMFSTGEHGWVTNSSETVFFKTLTVGDLLEARVSSGPPHGSDNSSIEIFYDWFRVDAEGRSNLVAQSKMLTTWVRIIKHGVVEVAPFPPVFADFFRQVQKSRNSSLLAAPLIDNGEIFYNAPTGIDTCPALYEHVFETTQDDSNLVGNVYFSNYATWLGRTRDHFFNQMVPGMYTGELSVEPFNTRTFIKHLREAMPFDQIQVVMKLKQYSQNGLKLYFEYYQFKDGKRSFKIAFAEHEVTWTEATRDSILISEMPASLHRAFKAIIDEEENIKSQKLMRAG